MQNNLLNLTVDHTVKQMKFGQPAKYCITVVGHLDASWSDLVGDMTITKSNQEDQDLTTTLVGRVRDQAELFGVLNTLYELHIPLLMVKILSTD